MHIPEALLLSPQTDGVVVMTSSKVSSFISHWLFAQPTKRRKTWIRKWLDSAQRAISQALQAINEEMQYRLLASQGNIFIDDIGLTPEGLDDIFTSLTTLLQWLYTLVVYDCIQKQDVAADGASVSSAMDHNINTYSGKVRSNLVYRRKLLEKGWCPFNIPLAVFTFMPGYANTIAPFFRGSPAEHAPCTDLACVAYNLKEDQYVTQHASGTCSGSSCFFLSPPFDHISALLSSGRIPVITYDGDRSLSVRSADDGPYVAISHVWADGLGSTAEKGLPICQILRIATYACLLVPDAAFWVDSLCVPEKKILRKDAIRLMAETYRRADKVVVFDAGLRSVCTTTIPIKEFAFRVQTSAWMHRVWTLQEAMLAQELHFEVADGLLSGFHLREAYATALTGIPSSLGLPMPREPLLEHYSSAFIKMINIDAVGGLRDILVLLRKRTTSKPEDETIAIAGLLGVDVAELLKEDSAEARMKAFLMQLVMLPADMIFDIRIRPHARLRAPGFRWAPRTLTQASSGPRGDASALCTSEGLIIEDELTLISFASDVLLADAPVDTGGVMFSQIVVHGLDDEDAAEATYYLVRSRWDDTNQYKPTWNGLITYPTFIRDGTATHYFDAIAVHITTMRSDSPMARSSSPSPSSRSYSSSPSPSPTPQSSPSSSSSWETLPSSSDDGQEDSDLSSSPVTCEYLFPAVLSQWKECPGSQEATPPLVAGSCTLERIILT